MLKPDRYYVSVLDIDPAELCARGYRAVLLDLDNTLQPRGDLGIPSGVREWVASLKRAGLRVAILSNTGKARAVDAANELGVVLVRNARKPLKGGYLLACASLGVACTDAVMIGDQSYTDVLGAHRMGMDAFLVMPQSTVDPLHTYALRIVDGLASRGMRAQGGTR